MKNEEIGEALVLLAEWEAAVEGDGGNDAEYEAAVGMKEFLSCLVSRHTYETLDAEQAQKPHSDYDETFRLLARRIDAAMLGQVRDFARAYTDLAEAKTTLNEDEIGRALLNLETEALSIARQLGEALNIIPENMEIL
ncbi:hypothetical protein ACFVH6_25600 [Spirillospora sp. NPDC127200]